MSLPAIITDAAVAAVMVLCVIWGAKRGLFKSLMGFVVLILALIVAVRAANFITDTLIEKQIRPATVEAIEARVDEMMAESVETISPLEEMEQVVEAIPNDFIRGGVGEIVLVAKVGVVVAPIDIVTEGDTIMDLGVLKPYLLAVGVGVCPGGGGQRQYKGHRQDQGKCFLHGDLLFCLSIGYLT